MTTENPYGIEKGAFAPVFVSCESTNDYAKSHPAPDTLFYAETQSGGKGREGKSFLSLPGGAYFSLGFYSDLSPMECTRYPILAGLAVCEILRSYGVDAKIKWPNDVYIGGKKVCGILVERNAGYVVVGIGVNVNNRLDGLSHIATSLQAEGLTLTPKQVIEDVAKRFATLRKLTYAHVLAAYQPLCFSIGREIKNKEGVLLGTAVSIDEEGFLTLRTPNGTLERLWNPVEE